MNVYTRRGISHDQFCVRFPYTHFSRHAAFLRQLSSAETNSNKQKLTETRKRKRSATDRNEQTQTDWHTNRQTNSETRRQTHRDAQIEISRHRQRLIETSRDREREIDRDKQRQGKTNWDRQRQIDTLTDRRISRGISHAQFCAGFPYTNFSSHVACLWQLSTAERNTNRQRLTETGDRKYSATDRNKNRQTDWQTNK